MSKSTDALRAFLAVRDAEEEFVAKKLAGKATKADREALHELRKAYRENERPPVSDGAAPAAIGTKGQVN